MANKSHESLAAEAAAYLAKSADAVEGFSGSEKEIRRQADCLVEWSRKRGVFLPDDFTTTLEKREYETTEHEVYFRDSDKRVVKCTYGGSFGIAHGSNGKPRRATPLFYLHRLELMNQEFPTDLRLEGITLRKSRSGDENEKRPSMVTSQSWIDAVDENIHPSDQQISDLMICLEFMRSEDSCYRWFRKSDGIMISDAKPDNFINSYAGVVPIDLIISKIAPEASQQQSTPA